MKLSTRSDGSDSFLGFLFSFFFLSHDVFIHLTCSKNDEKVRRWRSRGLVRSTYFCLAYRTKTRWMGIFLWHMWSFCREHGLDVINSDQEEIVGRWKDGCCLHMSVFFFFLLLFLLACAILGTVWMSFVSVEVCHWKGKMMSVKDSKIFGTTTTVWRKQSQRPLNCRRQMIKKKQKKKKNRRWQFWLRVVSFICNSNLRAALLNLQCRSCFSWLQVVNPRDDLNKGFGFGRQHRQATLEMISPQIVARVYFRAVQEGTPVLGSDCDDFDIDYQIFWWR